MGSSTLMCQRETKMYDFPMLDYLYILSQVLTASAVVAGLAALYVCIKLLVVPQPAIAHVVPA